MRRGLPADAFDGRRPHIAIANTAFTARSPSIGSGNGMRCTPSATCSTPGSVQPGSVRRGSVRRGSLTPRGYPGWLRSLAGTQSRPYLAR